MNIKKIIPILEWLPNYEKSFLKGDLIAGITVGIILIPQGIAYALIAGLPPIYGLYCALVPQVIYAIFGSARQVAIGPVAMDSLIVATGVSTLALAGSESYIEIAILLAFMVGTIQFVLGIFSLGFIVNFLSRPVITGFTSAVALIIGINQFRNLLGVDFVQSDQIHELLEDIWLKISFYNLPTTIIGMIAVAIIFVFRKIDKRIPSALIVVVLGIVIMRFFGKNLTDVSIVKNIPSGLPSFGIPTIELEQRNRNSFYSLNSNPFTLEDDTGFLAVEQDVGNIVDESGYTVKGVGVSNGFAYAGGDQYTTYNFTSAFQAYDYMYFALILWY